MKSVLKSSVSFLTVFTVLSFLNTANADFQRERAVLKKKMDLVWIVDNSASMTPFQAKLIASSKTFFKTLNSIQGLDWKVGVISTDVEDKPYLGFQSVFNSSVKNPSVLFQKAILSMGLLGSKKEKMMDAVVKHLQNQSFLRKGSDFTFFVLTDEDDQSTQKTADFVDWLKKTHGKLDRSHFGAFLGDEPGCKVPRGKDQNFDYSKSRYKKLVDAIGGGYINICQNRLSEVFGGKMKSALKAMYENQRIQLFRRPVHWRTIRVFYQGKPIPGGIALKKDYDWYYDEPKNDVVFPNTDFMKGKEHWVDIRYFSR